MTRKNTAPIVVQREHLTPNSRVLLDAGRIAIHEDCIMEMQTDGSWIRSEFADHLEIPETAAGDNSAE